MIVDAACAMVSIVWLARSGASIRRVRGRRPRLGPKEFAWGLHVGPSLGGEIEF